jgi:BlaI family transcriptional regulator, penicillinase repressor
MKRFKEVSETEMEIMDVLWKQEVPIATVDLLAYFNNEKQKGWKLQTLATFLTRLSEKGMVISESKGRRTEHRAAVTYEEYNRTKAKSILEVMYEGSIKNFFVALYGDKKLSKEEIADLKQWLSER